MKRVCLTLIMLFMLFTFLPVAAASSQPQLDKFNQTAELQQPAQISWRLSRLGKLSGDIIAGPNGTLLLPLGNSMACIDLQGNVLWETKGTSSGTLGQLVISGNNSIYAAYRSSIQEIKLNGTNGWNFSVYSESKGSTAPLLASGANDDILYLPLQNALYALNPSGNLLWMLSPWYSSDADATKMITAVQFLACAADKQAFYVVDGGKKGGYQLAAVSKKGKPLWTYWLGDITQSKLLIAEDGRVIVTASSKKSPSGAKGSKQSAKMYPQKVYSFRIENGSSPEWQYTLKTTTELSVPIIYKNKTIYLTGGNRLYALSADNGSIIWEEPLLNLVSPPAADPQTEHIYAGSSDGYLFAVNQSGHMVWQRTLDGSIDQAPLIGRDGFLYVFTQKGSLYKIKDNMK